MAAAAPFAYAWLNKTLGIAGAMGVSTGLTLVIAGLAIAIVRRPGRQTVSHCIPRDALTNGYKTPLRQISPIHKNGFLSCCHSEPMRREP